MSDPRSNVLYIFTDQQSADAMSCAGNPDVRTPATDRLAAEGVRFDRAYCTFPLCTPSRASMFTGRWAHQVGVRYNEQSMTDEARENGIGNLLSAGGYDCGYGGKWHIPYASPMEKGHGFEYINAFDDFTLADDTIEFMRRGRDRPFFCVASFDNPHGICEHGANLPLPWGPVGDPPPVEDCPLLPANHAPAPFAPAVGIQRGDWSPERWRRYLWTYYRLVEQVDREIGRILDAVDELGLADSTLVVLSSDHGDMLAAHRMIQKLPLYDECCRIPMIVRAPGGRAAAVDERLVSNGLDLYPTICDYAGVEPPFDAPGRSMRPLLEGAPADGWRDEVVVETQMGRSGGTLGRMVRTDRYKYIAYSRGENREQLFDMQTDPGETVNLAVSSRWRDVLQDHRDRLRTWCAATGDDFGYHYTHPKVPFIVPGDEYPPDSGGLPEGFED